MVLPGIIMGAEVLRLITEETAEKKSKVMISHSLEKSEETE